MGKIKTLSALIVLLILCQNYTFGQRFTGFDPDSTVIANEHFSFGIGLSTRQALITGSNDINVSTVTTMPAIGYHASAFYQVQMGRYSAAEVGVKVGFQSWQYRVKSTPAQNPNLSQTLSHGNTIYTMDAEVPLRIIGRYILNKDLLFFAFGGMSLNFFKPKTAIEVVRVGTYEIFETNYEVPGDNPYLNLQLGLGGIRRTFGYPLKFSVFAGIPLEKRDVFMINELNIKHPDNSNLGTWELKSRGGFFGLEISYVLPLRNTWSEEYPYLN